jgi:antitoxin (DNA-binding transcriptional repressor) of toxin-antitoxin stability system
MEGTKLPELVREVPAGDEVILTQDARPVAKLVPLPSAPPQRVFGDLKGVLTVADDFNDPLADFAGYP